MTRRARTTPISAWQDGDTSLLFGVIVAICGVLILWRALDPGNWQVLADEAPKAQSVVLLGCPPPVAQ